MEDFVSVANCRVRLIRAGAGRKLLLLHGSGGAPTWQPFMDRLADSFDVLVPEHPGFGGSEMPGWLDDISDYAYFYLDFLEQFDLQHVHLVGLSLGGWIAAELAMRCTSRLTSLTLVGASGLYVDGVQTIDTFMQSDEQRIRALFHDPARADLAVAQLLKPELEDVNLRNRATTARIAWNPRFYDPRLRKWLHRIHIPTLLLWGENDRLVPREHAAEFKKLIPQARVAFIPECGHLPNLEKPDDFLRVFKAFAMGVDEVA